MPVQVVYRKGKKKYRWGRRGKIYPTHAQAARQGKAIEASVASRGRGRA